MVDHRDEPRFLVRWRAAIVAVNDERHEIYHGKTNDLSISGASVLSDHNIFIVEPVVLHLAVPPLSSFEKETILEIKSRMVYTVFSAAHNTFRIGMHFQTFKNKDKRFLEEHLVTRFNFGTAE